MDKMPFYLVFLQSTPETALLVSLGLTLIGFKPRLLPILLVAFVTALMSFFFRGLPFPPGVNILLQLPVLITLIVLILKIPLLYSLLVSFLGLLCISLVETIFNILIFWVTGISVQVAMANPWWRVLYPIPEFIFLTILILLINHYNKTLINVMELKELESTDSHEEY